MAARYEIIGRYGDTKSQVVIAYILKEKIIIANLEYNEMDVAFLLVLNILRGFSHYL